MADRPYVLLSVAASVDGYIDDATDRRLVLSNDADLDRVDEVRAGCDAILVGANTIRRDNPRLLVRSAARQEERRARGLPPNPVKVTLTNGGELDPSARFFTTGEVEKLVYCPTPSAARTRERFVAAPGAVVPNAPEGGARRGPVTVVDAGDPLDLAVVLADLASRGVRRLMVEGGSGIHTRFLTAGLADEIHVVIAPFFVGDPAAPRFVDAGEFPQNAAHRMTLAEVRQIGDVVLLRYLPLGGRRKEAGDDG